MPHAYRLLPKQIPSLYITYFNYLSSPDPCINIQTFFIRKDTISLINILLNYEENNPNENLLEYTFWPDCKAIPAYGLMMSVCPSVCLSVRPSVNIWLTFSFKLEFALQSGHIVFSGFLFTTQNFTT